MNPVVIDTNIALDLLLFEEPSCLPLAKALAAGEWRWLVSSPMRDELLRVLGYPAVAARLASVEKSVDELMSRFDAMTQTADLPMRATCRCTDPDDQMFIDLAVAHGALLLSKDRAVLKMKKALAARGVPAMRLFGPPAVSETSTATGWSTASAREPAPGVSPS